MGKVRFFSIASIAFIVVVALYVLDKNYEGAQTAALVAITMAILAHLE